MRPASTYKFGRYGSAARSGEHAGRLRAVECCEGRKISLRRRRSDLFAAAAHSFVVAGAEGGKRALLHNNGMHPTR
jgi:hypothetical protein